MAKYQRNIILLMISILFIIPFLIPNTTTTLLPSEDQYIIIHVFSPELIVESTNNAGFTMNLYRLDSDGALIQIPVVEESRSSFSIQDLTPGQYQIHLFSLDICDVSVNQSGIYSVSLTLLIFISLVNLYTFFKEYYFVDY